MDFTHKCMIHIFADLPLDSYDKEYYNVFYV